MSRSNDAQDMADLVIYYEDSRKDDPIRFCRLQGEDWIAICAEESVIAVTPKDENEFSVLFIEMSGGRYIDAEEVFSGNIDDCMEVAEGIQRKIGVDTRSAAVDAKWHHDDPTEAQSSLLERLGLSQAVNKLEASVAISLSMSRRKVKMFQIRSGKAKKEGVS